MTRLNVCAWSLGRPALVAAGLFIAAVSARGATPLGSEFTYQGKLELAGAPVNNTSPGCDFVFRLWDDASAGSQVGPTLTFDGQGGNPDPIGVANGVFTVVLDFGGTAFSGDARWLHIAVRSPHDPTDTNRYTVLAPRQRLTPAPYALGLRFPFIGSFAGSDETAFSIAQTGLGYAAEFRATDVGNYYGSLGVSAAGNGPSLFVTNSGGGPCARLQNVVQANNTFPTLHATTFGTLPAVLGDAGVGSNGTGVSGVGQGTGHGVRGSASGTGFAGFFTGRGYFSGRVGIGTQSPAQMLDVAGTARAQVVEIAGADVAEKFPVSEHVAPGMVVAIDPDKPGQLCLARGAYNRRVAGIVSGANNLPAGAVLGHLPGSENAPPIALSGRVWAYCDATERPIEPGDLLTTSDVPGHAMKVIDHERAQGAILGKAMTALAEQHGLVLVLVSLQ